MNKRQLLDYLQAIRDEINEISLQIWNNPEISAEEKEAADRYRNALRAHGFTIHEVGHGIEHAFYAEYGSGSPVIALLGEYDALPNLSQEVDTTPNPVVEGGPGHGCGHNLLGAAAYGAAIAIKEYLHRTKKQGTVRFYGCPEEETLVGKVKMLQAGAFQGCDLALSWHPMHVNTALETAYLASNSLKFKFRGLSAHAAQSPESGRSALDAVELMNVGANYLREHVIDRARIHYTITETGGSPNIIPSQAESWYYIRAPHREDVESITARLVKVAEGAAMMTETTVKVEVLGGCYELLPNQVLFDLTQQNMEALQPPSYTDDEVQFATALQESLDPKLVEGEISKFVSTTSQTRPIIFQGVLDKAQARSVVITGSSDSGDVSWNMPMNLLLAAAWPLGVPLHTWQATAASGSSIGLKAMYFAAQVFTAMAYDLLNDPKLVEAAQAEFQTRTATTKYVSPLS